MRFKMDRLCELAGVPYSSRRGGLIRENVEQQDEAKHEEENEGSYHEGDMHFEDAHEEGMDHDEMSEKQELEDQDEMLDIDETMLVQELRRARKIMQEGKKKAAVRRRRKQESLQEAQLKAVIDQEVKNVIRDLNLNSKWIYGGSQPKRSKKGYVHQGSFLKGIGFK